MLRLALYNHILEIEGERVAGRVEVHFIKHTELESKTHGTTTLIDAFTLDLLKEYICKHYKVSNKTNIVFIDEAKEFIKENNLV